MQIGDKIEVKDGLLGWLPAAITALPRGGAVECFVRGIGGFGWYKIVPKDEIKKQIRLPNP